MNNVPKPEAPIVALWGSACNGNTEFLRAYYDEHPERINQRYNKFGFEYSLIMGALRNHQYKTVEYLMSIGETLTDKEKTEISTELEKIDIVRRLIV